MMPPLITTYTGKHFDITRPLPEAICIEDMAHALSLICRGNGHVRSFYSVGQHCLQCAREAKARGLSRRLVLAALLHDGTECYMSDVPRPLKEVMPIYRKTEAGLVAVIYRKFLGTPLTAAETKILKTIDDAFLWYDLTYLLDDQPDMPQPQVCCPPDYTVRHFAEVEREYLAFYKHCREV